MNTYVTLTVKLYTLIYVQAKVHIPRPLTRMARAMDLVKVRFILLYRSWVTLLLAYPECMAIRQASSANVLTASFPQLRDLTFLCVINFFLVACIYASNCKMSSITAIRLMASNHLPGASQQSSTDV